MLAKSLFKVLESRVASVGHWRPELLAVRGRPFLELLYGGTLVNRPLGMVLQEHLICEIVLAHAI